jgi:leucyl aminopeptidase
MLKPTTTAFEALASEAEPDAIVDLATLTGAIVTTFGDTHAGLFVEDYREYLESSLHPEFR